MSIRDCWTHTSSGKALDFEHPRAEDMDLAEICRALSHQCRYNGNTLFHYSVAQHSTLIARHLLEKTRSVRIAMAGLLHDAAEAYTGDITRPIQELLFFGNPQVRLVYKRTQAKLDRCISELVSRGLSVPIDPLSFHSHEVNSADLGILLDEREVVLKPGPRWSLDDDETITPLGVSISPMSCEAAASEWMDLYLEFHSHLSRSP